MHTNALSQLNQQLAPFMHGRQIPPLADWQPQFCGDMDLIIKANGEWWHQGSPIQRTSLIDLFSKVLWQENGEFFLKTPVEKIKIQVEDAPFQINRVEQVLHQGRQALQFFTPQDDAILLDEPAQLQFLCKNHAQHREYRPYLHVRFGLLGLVQRSVFYHLIELGELLENQQGTILTLNDYGENLQWLVPNLTE